MFLCSQTDDLSSASHFGDQRVIGANKSSIKHKKSNSVSLTRKLFEDLGSAILINGRVRRIRDIDTTEAIAAVSGGLIRKEGSSLSENSLVSSSSIDGLVARPSKHRRRRRCKNRLGCLRLAGRNGTVTSGAVERIDDSDEARSDRANEHRAIPRRLTPDRNLEKQLLLGNRSSALFRQGLVAATSGNPSTHHVVDPSSREIDGILADARSRRPHGQSEKKSVSDISSWRTAKQINKTIATGRSVGKRVTISVERFDKVEGTDEETKSNGTLSGFKVETGGLYHRPVHDRRQTPIIDQSTSKPPNYRTEAAKSVQYEFKVQTRKVIIRRNLIFS